MHPVYDAEAPPRVTPRVIAAPRIRQIYWCRLPSDAELPEFWACHHHFLSKPLARPRHSDPDNDCLAAAKRVGFPIDHLLRWRPRLLGNLRQADDRRSKPAGA